MTTPETSEFTSAYERVQAQQPQVRMKKPNAPKATKGKRVTRKERRALQAQEAEAALPCDHWLSPISLAPNHAAEVALTRKMPLAGRASSRGCIPLSDAQYLQLLDWTGREIWRHKRGAVPSELAPILERLSVTSDSWLKLVTSFRSLFRQSVRWPALQLGSRGIWPRPTVGSRTRHQPRDF